MAETSTLPDDRARELAEELARCVQHGADDRELIDLTSNALRVKQPAARQVVEEFQAGYHAGVRAVLGMEPPTETHVTGPLWGHAFVSGQSFTAELAASCCQERGRQRQRAPVGRLMLVAVVAVALVGLIVWV